MRICQNVIEIGKLAASNGQCGIHSILRVMILAVLSQADGFHRHEKQSSRIHEIEKRLNVLEKQQSIIEKRTETAMSAALSTLNDPAKQSVYKQFVC